jgi:GntR family transcriptional regulator
MRTSGDANAIARELRARIQAGELQPQDRLPTVDDLVRASGAARQTVQNALNQLSSEGLIYTQRGRRARVADPRPMRVVRWDRYNRTQREARMETTFEREVETAGWRGRVEYLFVGWVPCPADVATFLEIEPGEQVVVRQRRRQAAPLGSSGEPDMVLERVSELFTSWIPAWVAERTPAVLTFGPGGRGGTYSRIERDGQIPIDRFHSQLRWRSSSTEETAQLGLSKPTQVVVENRVVIGTGDRPVTVDRCVALANQVLYEFEYSHSD